MNANQGDCIETLPWSGPGCWREFGKWRCQWKQSEGYREEKGQEERQIGGKQVDVDESSYVSPQPESQECIFIGVAWWVNSGLFLVFHACHFCIICAVLSRRVQPQLKTSCTECCAMIILKKNLVLIAEDKLWVEDILPLARSTAGWLTVTSVQELLFSWSRASPKP